jgi:rSAM/selenodomain-associated transferase 1
MPRQQLIVFLKAPRVGQVKTRLAATIGDQAACGAYRLLANRLFAAMAGLLEVELRFSPDDATAEVQPWLRAGWTSAPQGEGDLGARLSRAFNDAFARGAAQVVIVGSDCPEMSESDVVSAWEQLADADVVIGPATDGGYWLIGLRAPQPRLFETIPWSTSQVATTTVRRSSEAGLRVTLLRELSDIDDEAGWRAYCDRTATAL